MPASLIEVRRAYTPEEETALIDAVHPALVAAFRIPAADKTVRLVVHAPQRRLGLLAAKRRDQIGEQCRKLAGHQREIGVELVGFAQARAGIAAIFHRQ